MELGLFCYGCRQPHQIRLMWCPTSVDVGCLVCGPIGTVNRMFDFDCPSGVTPVMHYDSLRGVIQGWLKEHEPDPVQRLAQIAYDDLKRDFRALEDRVKPLLDRQKALEVILNREAQMYHDKIHLHMECDFTECFMARCKQAKELLRDGHVEVD